jgi:hypothetical protein
MPGSPWRRSRGAPTLLASRVLWQWSSPHRASQPPTGTAPHALRCGSTRRCDWTRQRRCMRRSASQHPRAGLLKMRGCPRLSGRWLRKERAHREWSVMAVRTPGGAPTGNTHQAAHAAPPPSLLPARLRRGQRMRHPVLLRAGRRVVCCPSPSGRRWQRLPRRRRRLAACARRCSPQLGAPPRQHAPPSARRSLAGTWGAGAHTAAEVRSSRPPAHLHAQASRRPDLGRSHRGGRHSTPRRTGQQIHRHRHPRRHRPLRDRRRHQHRRLAGAACPWRKQGWRWGVQLTNWRTRLRAPC